MDCYKYNYYNTSDVAATYVMMGNKKTETGYYEFHLIEVHNMGFLRQI